MSPEAGPGGIADGVPVCAGAALLARAHAEVAANVIAEVVRWGELPTVPSPEDPAAYEAAYSFALHRVAARGRQAYGAEDYATRDEMVFLLRPRQNMSARCGTCHDAVRTDGLELRADNCIVTFGCEFSWAEQHPALYDPGREDLNAAPKKLVTPRLLPCGGDRCTALIRVFSDEGGSPSATNPDGKPVVAPRIVAGMCGVDIAGQVWRDYGRDELVAMKPPPTRDEYAIELNDGMRVTAAYFDRPFEVEPIAADEALRGAPSSPQAPPQSGQSPDAPPAAG